MNYLKHLLLTLMLVTLSGCATLEAAKQTLDKLDANWDAGGQATVERHRGAVSLRADTLSDKPRTVAALQQASAQGRYVEVFVHLNEYPIAERMQRSGIRVFLSSDRQLLASPSVILLDGGPTAFVYGEERFLKVKDLQQELGYRNLLRLQSGTFSSRAPY